MTSMDIGNIYRDSSTWQENRWQELIGLFSRLEINFSELKIGIDLGCGTGQRTLDFVKKAPWTRVIYAVDSNHSMIQTAIEHFQDEKISYDLKHIEDIDRIVASDVNFILANYSIHWVEDKEHVLRALNRMTTKGALMLVGTVERLPNMLQTIDDFIRGRWSIKDKYPYHFLKKTEWIELLDGFGWEIISELRKQDDHTVPAGIGFLREWYAASAGKAFYNSGMDVFEHKDIRDLEDLLSRMYGIDGGRRWLYNEQTYLFIARKR